VDIILTLLLLVPPALALWLANLSYKKRIEGDVQSERVLKLLAYGVLAALYAGLLLVGLLLQGVGVLMRANPGAIEGPLQGGSLSADTMPRLALSLWLPALAGVILLLRPVRRLFERFTSLDSANPVHAVSLSMTALIFVNLLFTVALGIGNLANMMETSQQAGGATNPAPALWAQNIAFFVIAVIGVGWLARRTLRGALNRLAIVVPSPGQVGLGLLAGLLMVPLVLIVEMLASGIGVGTPPDVEKLTEQLIGPLTSSIPGILTLGLAAALGEESIFRGAMHPRFGLVLTALLFALLHSQYGLSFSTGAVFVVGLVLGLIRTRANTSTSMITHAVYNMSLGLISYLGLLRNM
jgi:uncharacterized protein